jgi:hypothetical protein
MQHHDAQCALLKHARAAASAFTATRAAFIEYAASAMMRTVKTVMLGAVACTCHQMSEHDASFSSVLFIWFFA